MRDFRIEDAQEDHAFLNDGQNDVVLLRRIRSNEYPEADIKELSDDEWQDLINLVHAAKTMLDTLIRIAPALDTAANHMYPLDLEEAARFEIDAKVVREAITKATTC